MYRHYKIQAIDTTDKMVVFKFYMEDDSFRPYIAKRFYDDEELNSTVIERLAKDCQVEACTYYQRDEAAPPYDPETWTGVLKAIDISDWPDYNPSQQVITENWTETDTLRTRTFTVSDMSASQKAAQIRSTRTQLLQNTDSAALSDRTMSDEMRAYRQSLRDITNQETFPDNVIWPTKPIG